MPQTCSIKRRLKVGETVRKSRVLNKAKVKKPRERQHSYEIDCATQRVEPSTEYLELEAQPAISNPKIEKDIRTSKQTSVSEKELTWDGNLRWDQRPEGMRKSKKHE
jgi:hypothetical protein